MTHYGLHTAPHSYTQPPRPRAPPSFTEYLLVHNTITRLQYTIAGKPQRLSTCQPPAYLTAIQPYLAHFLSKLPTPTLLTVNPLPSPPQHASYFYCGKPIYFAFPSAPHALSLLRPYSILSKSFRNYLLASPYRKYFPFSSATARYSHVHTCIYLLPVYILIIIIIVILLTSVSSNRLVSPPSLLLFRPFYQFYKVPRHPTLIFTFPHSSSFSSYSCTSIDLHLF